MSTLERKVDQVKQLMEAHGLQLWAEPSKLDLTNILHSRAPVVMWSLRIGDPSNNQDIWVESLDGLQNLWCKAEQKLNDYIATK